jgi:hypothetical protein
MKHSAGFTRALIRLTPKFLVYGGSLINRTMGKVILPSTIRLFERTRRLEALIAVYFIDLVFIMALQFPYDMLAFVLGGLIVAVIYATLESDMYSIVRTVNYDNLGVVTKDLGHISRYISGFVSLSLVTILSLAALFPIWWASSLLILSIYFAIVLWLSWSAYRITRTPALNIDARPVRRRPQKGQRPFQPEFRPPSPGPDPGWDLGPGEPPSARGPAPAARTEEKGDDDRWGRL